MCRDGDPRFGTRSLGYAPAAQSLYQRQLFGAQVLWDGAGRSAVVAWAGVSSLLQLINFRSTCSERPLEGPDPRQGSVQAGTPFVTPEVGGGGIGTGIF